MSRRRKQQQPPVWALRFLGWYCKPELLEEIEGDAFELFHRRIQHRNILIAKILFTCDVLRFFRPSNLKSPTSFNFYLMQYHFKIAYRNLIKNKSFSFIHIFGLTIGLFATAILLLYVHYEYSYDKHHKEAQNIYRLTHTRIVDGKVAYTKASVFPELGLELEREFASIKSSARLFTVASEYQPLFSYEKEPGIESQFTETSMLLADSTITKIFDFTWIDGGGFSALSEPNKLIISKSLALRTFGRTDITGTSLTWQGMGTWVISGVFEDWPENSHLHFNALASWIKVYGEQSIKRWDGFYTYLLTTPFENTQQFEDEINTFSTNYLSSYNSDRSIESLIGVQPLTDIHLKSQLSNEFEINGNEDIVRGLLIMAIAILLIAIFNYINISTSCASQRSKEVGIRKIIGSGSHQIGLQFLVESFSLVISAHIITLLLLQLGLPAFNQWLDTHINLNKWFSSIEFWLLFLTSILLITTLSGGYPAFLLSRFKAIGLITKTKAVKSFSFRSILMTIQFSIAILFSILAIIVYLQVSYITNKDLGYNKDILVLNSMELISDNSDTAFVSKMETLKNKLASFHDLGEATLTSHIPGIVNNWIGQIGTVSGDKLVNAARIRVDGDFTKTFNLTLLEGRFYNSEDEEHPLEQVVINRKLAESLGFQKPSDAIGNKLAVFNRAVSIIGVIENYHSQSPRQEIIPSFYTLGPGHKSYLSVKLKSDQKQRAIKTTRDSWKQFFPEKPFNYFFIEDQMAEQFRSDKRLTSALGNFASLAIFLACLGLFGMSNFITNQRRKELDIRRIFGASYTQLLVLLSKKQVVIVTISSFLVSPIAFYIAEGWLSQYAYKINLDIKHFLLPVTAMVVIAIGTIWLTIRNLRKENSIQQLQ